MCNDLDASLKKHPSNLTTLNPQSNNTDYFNDLYEQNDDPWDYQNRWYEQRKRMICLSVLLKNEHQNVLEIGCSNGIFSQQLATRSKKLTCIDANDKAVQLAKNRLSSYDHVEVMQQCIPEQFPSGQYDLIVIGEILYYLSPAQIEVCIEKIQQLLTDDGVLLCCHWKYPVEGFALNGSQVHQLLRTHIPFPHYLSLDDADFKLDVWTKHHLSVAQSEGLTE